MVVSRSGQGRSDAKRSGGTQVLGGSAEVSAAGSPIPLRGPVIATFENVLSFQCNILHSGAFISQKMCTAEVKNLASKQADVWCLEAHCDSCDERTTAIIAGRES